MAFMTFNKEQAEKAGATRFETGAHIGLMQAEMVTASTGTKGMEFSLHGDVDVSYISTWYERKDGTELKGGNAFIQAFMAIMRVNEININQMQDQNTGDKIYKVNEFENKRIGMVLQKSHYTKNDGTDGYKAELIMPFCANTRKTAQELINNKPATTVDKILETLADKDERVAKQATGSQGGDYGMAQNNATANRPVSKFDQVNQNQNQNDGGFNQQQQPTQCGSGLEQNDDDFFNS